ncbi:MAG TPA: glutathione peroxidase [Steroidobacteraceae bacterium]|nr:glutathione peroxidase [Steroidobacteraceae bacterium]
MSASLFDIPVTRIDGQPATLAAFRGKVLLIVNVASKCGLTPQYTQLEKLYRAKHALGFEILGFPANNFMGQEPGADAEIAAFCSTHYDVHFPLFSKISVKGADRHPLYALLTQARPQAVGEGTMRQRLAEHGISPGAADEVLWNFEKFLVARDGSVAERFAPDVSPDDPRLIAAIDRALAIAA